MSDKEMLEIKEEPPDWLRMLGEVLEGIETYMWPDQTYYKMVRGYVETMIDYIRENNGLMPTVFGLLLDDVNTMVEKEMGFPPMTEEEAKLLGEHIGRFVDWEEAIKRTFWEVVMVKRTGEGSGINNKYTHHFECAECGLMFDVLWYIDLSCKCPKCKKDLTAKTLTPYLG